MTKMINYGIDLGTTNSLIARFSAGAVEVLKNPNGFKETLPSVVGYRSDRILVGDQARTYAERDPKSVASRFKRKMGTTEKYKIKATKVSKSPVELSAEILKELKTFVHDQEAPGSVVLTIPASFDTVQSNATKEAGVLAGFHPVVLLQEPIAASLAYANKARAEDLSGSRWLVYDLGGGTFDVALVHIKNGELKVVDHEGDNFLGGTDFDAVLVEKLVVPALESIGKFDDLLGCLKAESNKLNRHWYSLLNLAEAAKVELSARTSAEIDLGIRPIEDDDGTLLDPIITVTRSEYEGIIQPHVDKTIELMQKILTRNNLRAEDLKFVLMVGGSTLTPYVRERVQERLGVPVSTSIDPTNAVAVGAAYFAATKVAEVGPSNETAAPDEVVLKAVYARASRESEELFSARVEGFHADLFYRITRGDGAYDSGLKKLEARIVEELPLEANAYNVFSFRIYDNTNAIQPCNIDTLQIAQGTYSIAGQPLPDDICLVTDDAALNDTVLRQVFGKNELLPAERKLLVEVARTVGKGSEDQLRIIVVEGPAENHSSTNKPIGLLLIEGAQLSRDALRGTGIDLTFSMSESRDLTISAYVESTGQSFSQVFDPKPRDVPAEVLADEISLLNERFQAELSEARERDQVEVVEGLKKLQGEIDNLEASARALSVEDVTDDRYKLEDEKRRVSQQIQQITSGKKLSMARDEYIRSREEARELVLGIGNVDQRRALDDILAHDAANMITNNIGKIRNATRALNNLYDTALMQTPEYLMGAFEEAQRQARGVDPVRSESLGEEGRKYILREQWSELREVLYKLWDMLPRDERPAPSLAKMTGIV